MERRWACAASIARSRRPSAPSTWNRSTTTRVNRRLPRCSSRRQARQRSPPRSSTPPRRFATRSSSPAWSTARRRATTNLRSCWPRGRLARWGGEHEVMSPSQRLDAAFAALADPTRRAILARLASGEASVAELSKPFAMSQPAISKHLKVLERAGLISRGQDAQRRPRRLEAGPLAEANGWLEGYRKFWEESFERLDELLE